MTIKDLLIISLILLFSGCKDSSKNSQILSDEKNTDTAIFQKALIDSTDTLIETQDSIPLISGSCLDGRAIGNMNQYRVKMIIGKSPVDSINVRSNAENFDHRITDNVLGKIKSGTYIYAEGPLKNRGFSAGVGYAFPVKDKDGNICRGYLSYLNVKAVNQ